ncbi:MAG: hypothetical protein KJ072_27475 [Verrucomicrobia bacterium]|nr:hypothetical protein [Verrucomicrobiota bacterium]
MYREIWKRTPIEGEVEYNWQKQRESAKPAETFGHTPDETMTVPAYRRYMIDKIRRYQASYLDWPVAVGLLDPATKRPVWSVPLSGMDIRKWLPGEDWDTIEFEIKTLLQDEAETTGEHRQAMLWCTLLTHKKIVAAHSASPLRLVSL